MIKLNNIPNILTISRLLCCPLWLILFYFDLYIYCLILIFYSGITDFLDGFLARKYNATSIIGKALDPIADKIFTSTVLITFIVDFRANFLVVSVIIIRELMVSGLREALSNYNKSNLLEVTFLAKIKTTSQFLAIFILALVPLNISFSKTINNFGTIFLCVTAILTVYTGYKYVVISIKELKKIER
ncbi:CDP-diacylglycerol--glycerol-3-phosphate 3-phosphatidyltransferase [Alphaproteobacteria bacterium]|nr:CDP-diacylglycerol--glycerol-3-phosphate 3-phosphatidyltransferase [Alphaproteobacteria bacterium]